jgi:hypothetical protein
MSAPSRSTAPGARGLPEAVERAEQRGLAAAAGPDDAHHHAARHVEVDAAQDLMAARRLPPQLAHPYLGGSCRRPSCFAAGEQQPAHVQQEFPGFVVSFIVGHAKRRCDGKLNAMVRLGWLLA